MKRFFTILTFAVFSNFGSAQDMPLSQVLIPGEDWQLISARNGFTDAPTADDHGNFYFSDMRSEHGLMKIIPAIKVSYFLEGATGISGMKFGPDGKLYACRAKAREVVVIDPKTSEICLLYTSPSPRDATLSRMPSSA